MQVTLGADGALPPLVLGEEAMRWHVFDFPAPLPAKGRALPIPIECGQVCSPAALGRGATPGPSG